jgi:hypothetical protein
MALEGDVPIHSETEYVDVQNEEEGVMRFSVPVVELTAEAVNDIEVEG